MGGAHCRPADRVSPEVGGYRPGARDYHSIDEHLHVMSGILALLRTDDAPVEPRLVQRLTDLLALRGPDAQHSWCGGRVALGHALLRTTYESEHEHQPLSLDGQVWIVADGRVDARSSLTRALCGDFESVLLRAPDVELILRAYLQWGEACVEHLLGDFAFAIWDSRRQRLFCGRDQMGVKPFYYVSLGRWLLVGSTIECLRGHPEVSDRRDDLAIADFLLFGFNQDAATTSFHDVQRLPPAHTLTWSDTRLAIRRYWTLPIEEPVYHRRDRDFIDQFNQQVLQAVSDRLRTDRVSVFMSGGLDSTALAATAAGLTQGRGPAKAVQAFTYLYDSLIAHSEREYAKKAADHIGIKINYYSFDSAGNHPPSAMKKTPEPFQDTINDEANRQCYADMANHSRVAFYGEGPDNAFTYEWRAHLNYLFRSGRLARLAADFVKHITCHKRVPLLPTIPRMLSERKSAKQQRELGIPEWLVPELVDRLQLRERWRQLKDVSGSAHPTRPRGYATLLTSQWQRLFETLEPSYTGVSLEVRHPFVDIRLLRFLLRVPSVPWCRAKHLQRRALRGVIPEVVRLRPKTPLSGNAEYQYFRRFGLPSVRPSASLATYGDAQLATGPRTVESVTHAFRFVALSHWLSSSQSNSNSSHIKEAEGRGLTRTFDTSLGKESALHQARILHLREPNSNHG
jgi:asparagine synthase (glutamine-hydrolysing)